MADIDEFDDDIPNIDDLDAELATVDTDEPDLDDDQDDAEDDKAAPKPDDKPADDTAQLRAEIEALKREKHEERKAEQQRQAQWQIAQLETKEAELKTQRKAALEADDLDEESRLSDEILEIKLQRKLTAAPAAETPSVAPAAQAWADANPRFHTDAQFKQHTLAEYQKLQDEGYDYTHPRFYQELDKRLNRTPRMTGDIRHGGPVSRSARTNDTSAEASRQDRGWMEKFGINPNDKRAVKHWKSSKGLVAQMTRGGR